MIADILAEKNPKRSHTYVILIERDMSVPDLIQWGHENLRGESWCLRGIGKQIRHAYFAFDDETDAVLIRLRWPDCSVAEFDAAGALI